jgi:hypothetical protein
LFWLSDWESSDDELVVTTRNRQRKFVGEEVVVLTRILTDEVNFGYEDCEFLTLTSVNGIPIKNLLHVQSILKETTVPIVEFLFGASEIVALERTEAATASERILKQHKIIKDNNLDEFY